MLYPHVTPLMLLLSKWTKCGVIIMTKNINLGCGGLQIMIQVHLQHLHSDLELTICSMNLQPYWKKFNIGAVYTDNNFAYSRIIPQEVHFIGKLNTQHIERRHLTLRTRIKRLGRKTICFSKNEEIHQSVIGTFINKEFFT